MNEMKSYRNFLNKGLSVSLVLYVIMIGFVAHLLGCSGQTDDTNSNGNSHIHQIKSYILEYSPIETDMLSDNGEILQRYADTYFFDRNGHQITHWPYPPNQYKWEYLDDENGNMVEIMCISNLGSTAIKYICEYDVSGNIVSKTNHTGAWRNGYKWIHTYDDKNRLAELRMIDTEDKLWYLTVFSYNNDEAKVDEILTYDEKGKVDSKHTFLYDPQGNLSEESKYVELEGLLRLTQTIHYDDHGKETQEINYALYDSTLFRPAAYRYEEFDEYGNWTKRIVFTEDVTSTNNTEQVGIEDRLITYYNYTD